MARANADDRHHSAAHSTTFAAASDALGPGVEPAFQFVRDRIGFESYCGVLRGASGTLTSRAGNALDRSLLVADILKRKGIRTRFAVGRLDPSHAERLIARLFGAAKPAARVHLRRRRPPSRSIHSYARVHEGRARLHGDSRGARADASERGERAAGRAAAGGVAARLGSSGA